MTCGYDLQFKPRNRKIVRMTRNAKPARVITITSGKGGVGKTHTTVNLGLALAKIGKRVLLLDADLGLANINIMLGFEPKSTLHDVLNGRADIRDIIVHYPAGIDIIPASSGIPEMTMLSEEEKIGLVSAFDQFADEYDYLLIDTAAGIGDNVLYFSVAAEQILVVIDPEPTSITDAYALIKVLSTKWGTKEFDVVVNRCPAGSDGRGIFGKLATVAGKFLPVKLNFAGAISDDPSLSEAVIRQVPLLQLYPGTKAARDITRIATNIDSSQASRAPKGGLQFFFRALIENM